MSLGDRLAVIEAAKAKADAERKTAEEAEALKRLQALNHRRRSLLHEKINRWKEQIVRAIEANELPETLAIERIENGCEFMLISDDRHRDHDIYRELEAWAHDNGMRITYTINSRYAGDIPVYAVTAQI